MTINVRQHRPIRDGLVANEERVRNLVSVLENHIHMSVRTPTVDVLGLEI